MDIPPAYRGREQTFLKHRALWEYETQWGLKVGPSARKLWYVDGFAGPWKSQDEAYQDTSFHLGIEALKYAHGAHHGRFDVGAILIEENPRRFAELQARAPQLAGGIVDIHAFPGRFEDHVTTINSLIADDPAMVFIDPKGWKGAGMRHVAAVSRRWRDVLIRVAGHLHRLGSVAPGASEFFGVQAVPQDRSPDETIALYCEQLKSAAGFRFAADMVVLSPTRDSISSWLVIGGRHPKVLEVFRDTEAKVVGGIAAEVRGRAKATQEFERTGQYPLFREPPSLPELDKVYQEKRDVGLVRIRSEALSALADGPLRFDSLWPVLLEKHHVTRRDAEGVVRGLVESGLLADPRHRPRERSIKDGHMLMRRAPVSISPPKHRDAG